MNIHLSSVQPLNTKVEKFLVSRNIFETQPQLQLISWCICPFVRIYFIDRHDIYSELYLYITKTSKKLYMSLIFIQHVSWKTVSHQPVHSETYNTCVIFRASKRKFTRQITLLLRPGDRLRLLSKLRFWGPIQPVVSFHKCFISFSAECLDNISFIQSSKNIVQKSKRILHNYFSK